MPPSSTATFDLPDAVFGGVLLRLFGSTQNLVAVFDQDDLLWYANPAFRAAYDLADDARLTWGDLMRHNFAAGVGAQIETDNFDQWLASATLRRGKKPFRAFEADLTDGRWLWMTETIGDQGHMLCMATDVSSLRQSERALREARDQAVKTSTIDPLTSIGNRLFVMNELRRLIGEQCGADSPGYVAILDLDHFKRINDNFGHSAGDRVLIDFAKTIQAFMRREDVFGRIGGEEFAILFPRLAAETVPVIAERILGGLRSSQVDCDGTSVRYTCSIGFARIAAGDTPEAALRKADIALYAAKGAGRDGFIVY